MADFDSRVLHQFGYNGDSTSESNESAAYAEIVVIRHGETEFNATKRMQGQLDVELNDVGRAQATAVAHRLSRERKVSIVYSSDLKRALDTAEAIASSCGGLEIIKEPDLRERHLGDLQGLVHHEAAKVCPKAYRAFSSRRTDQEIPGGGESLDQLYDRCTSVLERIGSKHKGERVVMVTHGGVIRTLYELASPSGQPGRVLNTSVNIFHLSDGDIWTIKSWGDVSHLSQTEYLESGFGGDTTSGLLLPINARYKRDFFHRSNMSMAYTSTSSSNGGRLFENRSCKCGEKGAVKITDSEKSMEALLQVCR